MIPILRHLICDRLQCRTNNITGAPQLLRVHFCECLLSFYRCTVLQYSDLFWCGRGDSASRALKTVRRTVFARRDADGGHGLFESPLAASHTISYKTKKQHPKECCSWCGRGDSNLWPLESENCDGWQNAMIKRRKLCGMHNFRRFLWVL